MREILFRGKRTYNGRWIYGSLVVDSSGNTYIVWEYESCKGVKQSISSKTISVIPSTVGQYTGLKDKNGVRIFEGDIVECWSEGVKARGTIQQRIDGLWIIYPAWQKRIMWGLCPDNDGNTTVEIIGNIHENPELLKGSN